MLSINHTVVTVQVSNRTYCTSIEQDILYKHQTGHTLQASNRTYYTSIKQDILYKHQTGHTVQASNRTYYTSMKPTVKECWIPLPSRPRCSQIGLKGRIGICGSRPRAVRYVGGVHGGSSGDWDGVGAWYSYVMLRYVVICYVMCSWTRGCMDGVRWVRIVE